MATKNQYFSKHLHDLFMERFKGRITSIGKEGQVGMESRSSIPINKTPKKYLETYTIQQTPVPPKKPMEFYISNPHTKQRYTSSQVLCAPPLIRQTQDSCISSPKVADFATIMETEHRRESRYKEISRAQEIIVNDLKKPFRRQSLPRSYRSVKKHDNQEQGKKAEVEVLARTNFQKIGYMSLSIGDSMNFYKDLAKNKVERKERYDLPVYNKHKINTENK